MRRSDLIGELVAGLLALVLVAADVFLTIRGKADTGIQGAVPVIVAFYYAGRVTNTAWASSRKTEADIARAVDAKNGIEP